MREDEKPLPETLNQIPDTLSALADLGKGRPRPERKVVVGDKFWGPRGLLEYVVVSIDQDQSHAFIRALGRKGKRSKFDEPIRVRMAYVRELMEKNVRE